VDNMIIEQNINVTDTRPFASTFRDT